jgi:hypothetical protein
MTRPANRRPWFNTNELLRLQAQAEDGGDCEFCLAIVRLVDDLIEARHEFVLQRNLLLDVKAELEQARDIIFGLQEDAHRHVQFPWSAA